jgi:nicotinamidase/pyrazinamidase
VKHKLGDAVLIEEACRGLDLDGSFAAAHRKPKSLGIPMVHYRGFFSDRRAV